MRRAWQYLKRYQDKGESATRTLKWLQVKAGRARFALDVAKGAAVGGFRASANRKKELKRAAECERKKYELAARMYLAAVEVVASRRKP